MAKTISTGFEIYGKAVPKARPRFTGNKVVFTPKETVVYEKHVRRCFFLLADRPKEWDSSGPVDVDILIHTTSRRKMDIDNIAKSVLDALNKTWLWNDDKQVSGLTVRRNPTASKDKVDFRAFQVVAGEPAVVTAEETLAEIQEQIHAAMRTGDKTLASELLLKFIERGGSLGPT